MDTIGLIAAMPLERDALLRLINGWKRVSERSLDCIRFEVSGQTCLLVTSGMGVRRASQAALDLIGRFAPRALISYGIAGAVEADLRIGDVVLAESVCRLENGELSSCLPLAVWHEFAREACGQALSSRGGQVCVGTTITTGGSQLSMNQVGNLQHPVLEMETAGIAEVAAEKNIPLYALRAISDGPSAPIPFDLTQVMDNDANLNPARLLMALARHPKLLLQAGQMLKNSRIAADNAASALLAVLRQRVLK